MVCSRFGSGLGLGLGLGLGSGLGLGLGAGVGVGGLQPVGDGALPLLLECEQLALVDHALLALAQQG